MHTFTRTAYLYRNAALNVADIDKATTKQLSDSLTIFSFCPGADYIPVGDCEVHVHLHQRTDIVGNAVETLKERQRELRAKAAAEDTRLEGEIQSLLSLTYKDHK
jgi:hypothetical protein